MILLDSCHYSSGNEVLFMKIVAIVLDIWLDTFPVPKVKKFFEISLFYWIHVMILEKMRSCL